MSATTVRPERQCDIVMKGGITSGVVYPHAVCELAGAYRLKNVGGTSAGAIAAAAAAAAEYGRETWRLRPARAAAALDRHRRQPGLAVPAAEGHPRCLQDGAGGRGARAPQAVLGRPCGAVRLPLWALLGALPGVGLGVPRRDRRRATSRRCSWRCSWRHRARGGRSRACRDAAREAPAHPCRAGQQVRALLGHGGSRTARQAGAHAVARRADRRPRRPWLGGARAPAHLRRPLGGAGGRSAAEADPAEPWMRLEMMTTNVTNRRAERLPWASREYFFDPRRDAGPLPRARGALARGASPVAPDARPRSAGSGSCMRGLLWPLRPLPEAADLPVLVATRMSLSFPVLLSAVPLRRVDWTHRGERAEPPALAEVGQGATRRSGPPSRTTRSG